VWHRDPGRLEGAEEPELERRRPVLANDVRPACDLDGGRLRGDTALQRPGAVEGAVQALRDSFELQAAS
jgi:hypothetical protein